MSLFTEFLDGEGIDVSDFEPEELTWLCEDPVFRIVADYCSRSRGWNPPAEKFSGSFDADELGLDPEEYP